MKYKWQMGIFPPEYLIIYLTDLHQLLTSELIETC